MAFGTIEAAHFTYMFAFLFMIVQIKSIEFKLVKLVFVGQLNVLILKLELFSAAFLKVDALKIHLNPAQQYCELFQAIYLFLRVHLNVKCF